MRSNITPGSRFKNLKVIKLTNKFVTEISGKKRRLVLVQCDCGQKFNVRIDYLRRKGQKCTKCRFNTQSIVKIGTTYDQLTVLRFDPNHGRKLAICRCICGTLKSLRPEMLINNKTNNCGCKPRGNWKGIGLISKTILNRIKRNAKVRRITFKISIKYLWELYLKQNGKCALTGLDIPFGKFTTDQNDASLDRIDSNKGYVKGNLQWIHKDLQKMKMDLSQDKFIELCKLVSLNNFL